MIAHALATLALFGLALLFGATAYESVVMAPNYARDIPDSLDLARRFLKRTTPAHYFRVLTPITQLLLLAGLVSAWPVADARWRLSAALGIVVLLDVITFTFHYPRLAIMFKGPLTGDRARLGRAASGWARGNIVRALLLAAALAATLQAVTILAG